MSNNKNNDNNKLNSTRAKFASAGLVSSVAFAVASPLIINAVNHKDSQTLASVKKAAGATTPSLKTVKDEKDPTKDIEIGLPSATIPRSETPSFLYFIPTFAKNVVDGSIASNPNDSSKLSAAISNLFFNAFTNYGIDDDSLTAPYLEALSKFYLLQNTSGSTLSNNKQAQLGFDAAKKLLSDPTITLETYNKMNGLGSPVDASKATLKITKPKEVRNIMASTYGVSGNDVTIDQSNSLLKTDGFAYKVAEIKLDKLQSKKSLIFKYKDHTNPNEDYRIVLSNENNEINRFISSNGTLSDLIKNQTIFVRDMNKIAKKPETSQTQAATPFDDGKIKFTYDKAKQTLSLLVIPDDANTGTNTIDISVDSFSDKEATKSEILQFGLLDNTLAPTYLKQFTQDQLAKINPANKNAWDATAWMGTTVADLYGSDPTKRGGSGDGNTSIELLGSSTDKLEAKDIPVFSASGEWNNNSKDFLDVKPTDANWLRLFMGDGTKFTKPLQFNGKLDDKNFGDGSETELSVSYASGFPATIKPDSGIIIRDSTAKLLNRNDLGTAQIAVRTEEIENTTTSNPKDKYLKTDIGLNAGLISFDAVGNGDTSEKAFSIANPATKIFFEDPFAKTSPALAKNLHTIRTAPQIATADRNEELIANVVENWANKVDPTSSTRILSQKEFIEKLKQIPTYKPDFDKLDTLNKELVKLNDDLKLIKDPVDVANQQSVITQQESMIKTQLQNMMAYLPVWPTTVPGATAASPADAYMIFSADYYKPLEEKFKISGDDFGPVKANLDNYVYQYRQYSVGDDGSLVTPTETTQGLYKYVDDPKDKLGLALENNTFKFETDDKGNKTKLNTVGTNIYEHFLKYTNEIFRWEKDKLLLGDSGISKKDDYKMIDGKSLGWVKSTIIGKAGAAGTELLEVSNMFVRIWNGSPLTTHEKEVKDTFNKTFGDLFPGWEKLIEAQADQSNPQFKIDSPNYIVSQQMIYNMLQPYLVKCFNSIMATEVGKLDTFILASTEQAFKAFFKQTNDVHKISDSAIKYVNPVEDVNKQMKFITAGDYSVLPAENGCDSLKSLIKFIYASGISLENIGLTTDELNAFQTYAADIDTNLSDALFDNTVSKQKFSDFVSLLSKILDHVLQNANQTYTSLSDIASNIQRAVYDAANASGKTAVSDLTDTIKKAIDAITNSAKSKEIDVLGAKADYSYLESLVIGRNIFEIYTEYLRRITPADQKDHSKDAEINEIKDFLAQNKQYDQSSVVNLAFALGYYNVAYFIQRLTNPNEVEPLADEMLKSDLTKSVQLKVDSGNEVVNFLSNPKTLAKYSFMGIGGALTLAGGSIFGLSFRKSIRMSRKNVIIERFIFAGIIGLGLALTLFGVIPSIL